MMNKFDKSKFKLSDIDSWDDIDTYIKDFLIELNKSNDINTLYSCEGHNLGDDAYIYFNVSDDGWNIFLDFNLQSMVIVLVKNINIFSTR